MTLSRFVKKDTARVDLGEGDWAILRYLTYGDRRAVEAAITNVHMEGSFLVQNTHEVNSEKAHVEMLRRAIVGWGGPGFGCDCGAQDLPHKAGCAVVPITPETVSQLNSTGDILLEKVQERQDEASPKAPSSNTSPTSPGEVGVSPATSVSSTSSGTTTSQPEPASTG